MIPRVYKKYKILKYLNTLKKGCYIFLHIAFDRMVNIAVTECPRCHMGYWNTVWYFCLNTCSLLIMKGSQPSTPCILNSAPPTRGG